MPRQFRDQYARARASWGPTPAELFPAPALSCSLRDKDFAASIADALEEGTDRLEDEAFRRTRDGFDEPRFYEGQVCGYVLKYSYALIIFLLKARRPEKYRDRRNGRPANTGSSHPRRAYHHRRRLNRRGVASGLQRSVPQ
jgi:hypothetical protein